MADSSSLTDLPDELIHNIFVHLPASSAALLGQTSKRLHKISRTPSLWRQHCREMWKFWEEREGQPTPDYSNARPGTEWQQVFLDKVTKDQKILATFEELLASQQNRMARIQEIVETYKYDAKDILERQLNVSDHAEDVLARRYWSAIVLGLIHRQKAIDIWNRMQYQDYSPLEEALCAFDIFVQQPARHAEVSTLKTEIDNIARNLKSSMSDWDDKDYIAKAVSIARYLREQHLVGCDPADFHLLRNRFICHTLTHDGEKTLIPLQSVALFCCVAQRLGVRAWPCEFPAVVHAVIEPPDGPYLKDTRPSQKFGPGVVWMDPHSHDQVFSEETMRTQLSHMRDGRARYPFTDPAVQYSCLTRAHTRSMVSRTSANILASLTTRNPSPEFSPSVAIFCALWSSALMSQVDSSSSPAAFIEYQNHLARVDGYFDHQIQHGQSFEEAMLIERHIFPSLAGAEARNRLAETLETIRAADVNAKPVTHRDERTGLVKYKVGQAFRHIRYGYVGAIIGWDPSCQAGDAWIQTMRVRELPRGCEQSFYHVIAADEALKYVAEENMQIMDETPPDALMKLAGRYFKRWDDERKVFVSNVRDEYPDD